MQTAEITMTRIVHHISFKDPAGVAETPPK